MRSLDLSSNPLGDEGASAILIAIGRCTTFVSVNLSIAHAPLNKIGQTGMTEDSAKQIVDVARQNRLVRLDLCTLLFIHRGSTQRDRRRRGRDGRQRAAPPLLAEIPQPQYVPHIMRIGSISLTDLGALTLAKGMRENRLVLEELNIGIPHEK